MSEQRVSIAADGGDHAPGPLFQYQRKVESGNLMAGDQNQVILSIEYSYAAFKCR